MKTRHLGRLMWVAGVLLLGRVDVQCQPFASCPVCGYSPLSTGSRYDPYVQFTGYIGLPPADICNNTFLSFTAQASPMPGTAVQQCPICGWTSSYYSYNFDSVSYSWVITLPDYTTSSGLGLQADFYADQVGWYVITFTAQAYSPLSGTKYFSPYPDVSIYADPPCTDGCWDCTYGPCNQVFLCSVDVRLSLGNRPFKDKPIGRLRLHEETPSPLLASPQLLRYEGPTAADSGVEVIRAGGVLRQVRSPQWLADIVVINAQKYEVRFYANSGSLVNGLYQPDAGSLAITTTIENPDGATAFNRLKVTRTVGDHKSEGLYTWLADSGTWQLETGNGLKKERLRVAVQGDARVEYREVRDPQNQIVRQRQTTWRKIGFLYHKTEEVEDPAGAQLRAQYGYDEKGRRVLTVNPDGSWEQTQFDALGRKWRVFSSFLNQGPTTDPALGRMTEYSYQPVAPQDNGSVRPLHPRMAVEYLKDKEIGRTYYVVLDGEEWTIQCPTPGAAWNAPDNLVTITKTHTTGPLAKEPKSIHRPDGTMETYQYDFSADGRTKTTTVSVGQPGPDRSAIIKGSKTITVVGTAGETLSRIVTDIESGLTTAQETHSQFDLFRRAQRVDYLDGTHESRAYGCCGLETVADREGTVTGYGYDDLDRRFITTRNGISTIETLDAAGRSWARTRQGTDGSQMVSQRDTFDLAGRLLTTTDARGGQTTYAYQTDTAGQRVVTATYADGGQRVETYARGGQLLKVAGNATAPVRYEYGVEPDNGVNRAFSKSVKLDAAFADTAEWTKSYADGAGRPLNTVYPDGATQHSSYSGQGQLVKDVDPDGVTRLYGYNAKGEREYSAVDMNGDGQINLDGADRVTRTVHEYGQREGLTVQRTLTYVWSESGKDSPQLVSSQETSLNGQLYMVVWRSQNGLTRQTRTTLLGQGVRLVTEIEPDGSLALSASHQGRVVSVTRQDGKGARMGQTAYGYDVHGRRTQVTDARNGTTTYQFDNADRVVRVTTPPPATDQPPQTTTTEYDLRGRTVKITYPDGGSVVKEYYPSGKLKAEHGARTYPVEYGYGPQGRMTSMTTYADYANRKGAAATHWEYDPQRGWLTAKRYADGTGPQYSYYPSGKTKTRTWARGILTSYAYTAAGELASVAYSDGQTPGGAYEYDRLGRQVKIIQGAITTTRTYNAAGQLLSESYTGGPLDGLSVNNTYDNLLRRTTLQASRTAAPSPISSLPSSIHSVSFTYDPASRLDTVSDGTDSATYSYLANSPLVEQIAFKHNGQPRMTTTKRYDAVNRLTLIESRTEAGVVSSHSYDYNLANQRVTATLEDGSHWDYAYDDLGQVISGKRTSADATPAQGEQFEYAYDDIGNRISATPGDADRGPDDRIWDQYQANALNQYTHRATQKGQGKNKQILRQETFAYDGDGNLIRDGQWTYAWDAENRLAAIESISGTSAPAGLCLEFTYDHQGRRIAKEVYAWNPSSNSYLPSSSLAFLYDGWSLIAELGALQGPSVPALRRSYLWGPDPSGRERAGGEGSVLAIVRDVQAALSSFAICDSSGNVNSLVNASDGSVAATFQYGPLGEIIVSPRGAALFCPLQQLAKYYDQESDLLLRGSRYFRTQLARNVTRLSYGARFAPNAYSIPLQPPGPALVPPRVPDTLLGEYVCDITTLADPNGALKNDDYSVTRDCTQRHEEQHLCDLGVCCYRGKLGYAQALADGYDGWYVSWWGTYVANSLNWTQCNAYQVSVDCANSLWTQNKCNTCKALLGISGCYIISSHRSFWQSMMNQYCSQNGTGALCPYD